MLMLNLLPYEIYLRLDPIMQKMLSFANKILYIHLKYKNDINTHDFITLCLLLNYKYIYNHCDQYGHSLTKYQENLVNSNGSRFAKFEDNRNNKLWHNINGFDFYSLPKIFNRYRGVHI